MFIRKVLKDETTSIMQIYDKARTFMRENGNKNQWTNGYPSKSIIENDIESRTLSLVLYYESRKRNLRIRKNGPSLIQHCTTKILALWEVDKNELAGIGFPCNHCSLKCSRMAFIYNVGVLIKTARLMNQNIRTFRTGWNGKGCDIVWKIRNLEIVSGKAITIDRHVWSMVQAERIDSNPSDLFNRQNIPDHLESDLPVEVEIGKEMSAYFNRILVSHNQEWLPSM